MTPQSPLQPLTRQQVYDRIIGAVRDFTMPGYDARRGVCVYDNSAGRHCVVGIFGSDLGLALTEQRAVTEQAPEAIQSLERYTGLPPAAPVDPQNLPDHWAQREWRQEAFILALNRMDIFWGCELAR